MSTTEEPVVLTADDLEITARRNRVTGSSDVRSAPRRPGSPTGRATAGAIGQNRRSVTLRRRAGILRTGLLAADVVSVVGVFAAAIAIVPGASPRPATLLAVPAFVGAAKLIGLYDRDELVMHGTTLDEGPALLQLSTLAALVSKILERPLLGVTLGDLQLLGLWLGLLVVVGLLRQGVRVAARRWLEPERCLLIATPDVAEVLLDKLSRHRRVRAALVAQILIEPGRSDVGAFLRDSRTLGELVEAHGIHRVIIAPSIAQSDLVLDVIRETKLVGVNISLLPRMFEVVGSSVVFDDLGGMPMLGVRRFGLSRSAQIAKRTLDLIGSAIITLALSPLLLLIAWMVRRDSRGPVLFRQTRVGRDGEPFELVKFRTMFDGAELSRDLLGSLNEAEGLFKIADDPRITRAGKWLRKTSLDELPQLWNVLRGDMSLVGPRPLVIDDDRRVEGWHRRRLHLKPGMTGQWQILGSSRIPLREMVKIDYLYVANWSLWSDLKILIRTVPYVLARRGM